MTKRRAGIHRPNSVKGFALLIAALIVLLTYPVGVVLAFTLSTAPNVGAWQRLWYSLGWPLSTFTGLIDRSKKHLPQHAA